MPIDQLDLSSLKKISNGNVALGKNSKLCYIDDLDLKPLFTLPTHQRFDERDNKSPKQCGKYKAGGAGHKKVNKKQFNAFLSGFVCYFLCVQGNFHNVEGETLRILHMKGEH